MGILPFGNKYKEANNILHISIDFKIITKMGSFINNRNDTYIEDAINIFGLNNLPEPEGGFAGIWEWNILCNLTRKHYNAKKDKLKAYFEKLYDDVKIQGAVWSFKSNIPEKDFRKFIENVKLLTEWIKKELANNALDSGFVLQLNYASGKTIEFQYTKRNGLCNHYSDHCEYAGDRYSFECNYDGWRIWGYRSENNWNYLDIDNETYDSRKDDNSPMLDVEWFEHASECLELLMLYINTQKTHPNLKTPVELKKSTVNFGSPEFDKHIEELLTDYGMPMLIMGACNFFSEKNATIISAHDVIESKKEVYKTELGYYHMPQWVHDVTNNEEKGYVLVISDFDKISIKDQSIFVEILENNFCGQLIPCAPALRIVLLSGVVLRKSMLSEQILRLVKCITEGCFVGYDKIARNFELR